MKQIYLILGLIILLSGCTTMISCPTGEQVEDISECPVISKEDAMIEVNNYIDFFENSEGYPETSRLAITNVYVSENEWLGEMRYDYIEFVSVPGKDVQDQVKATLTFVLHIDKFTGRVNCLNVLEMDLELCGQDIYNANLYK